VSGTLACAVEADEDGDETMIDWRVEA